MLIIKKRINSIEFIKKLKLEDITIGIKVNNKEYEKLGISKFEEGRAIEPSPLFGTNCKKNTFGYSYPDKTKPKKEEVIGTRHWRLQDWGGHWHSGYSNIIRKVYPKIEIAPTNIEFIFVKNKNGNKFIIANISESQKTKFLKQTINMFLEIFGFCEIFTKNLELISNKIKRCNWKILPPGIKSCIEEQKTLEKENKKNRKNFEKYRLEVLDNFNPLEIYEGTGGFTGYYAYIFNKTCFLESGAYGNATYIIAKNEWKSLSKLSKNDLSKTNKILEKIIHNEKWEQEIKSLIKKFEGK